MNLFENIFSRLLYCKEFRGKHRLLRTIKYMTNDSLFLKSYYDVILKEKYDDLTWRLAFFGHKDSTVYDELYKIEPGSCFIDIGANYGIYTLIAAKLLGPNGLVISFEPNPIIYEYLVQNVNKNKFKCPVLLFNFGIASCNEVGYISYKPSHSGLSCFVDTSQHECLKVAIINGENLTFLQDYIDGREVFFKIDVEGMEFDVIKSLRWLMSQDKTKKSIVEIDDEHLNKYKSQKSYIYKFFDELSFSAQKNYDKKHYDEIFIKI